MLDMKSDLLEVRATKGVLEKELHNMLLQLHAVQLQLHEKSGLNVDSEQIKKKLVSYLFFLKQNKDYAAI